MQSQMRVLVVLLAMAVSVQSVRVFLLGGLVPDNNAAVYSAFASACRGTPQPNKCDLNWNTTKCPKIAVITSASDGLSVGTTEYTKGDKSYNQMAFEKLFPIYGMAPIHVTVHNDNYLTAANPLTTEGKKNMQILSQCDAIFFNGGDQSRHARSWLQDDGTPNELFKIIKKRAEAGEIVLAGTSAGTMIMSDYTFGGGSAYGVLYFAVRAGLAPKNVNDGSPKGSSVDDTRNGTNCLQYSQNAGKLKGFGFVPFQADTHIDARARLLRMIPVAFDLKQEIIVGIDEPVAIEYFNGKGTVWGTNGSVTIANLKNAEMVPGPLFSIRKVRLWVLSPGDKFDFVTRSVESSRTPINIPANDGYYDSPNILLPQETNKILFRLIDQKGVANRGFTKTPTAFPQNTAIWVLSFYKDSLTAGYKDPKSNTYTVQNALLDISYQAAVTENDLEFYPRRNYIRSE